MHTIKITPNLLFEYQCTRGKFIRLPNRKKIDSVAKIESNRNFSARIGMLYLAVVGRPVAEADRRTRPPVVVVEVRLAGDGRRRRPVGDVVRRCLRRRPRRGAAVVVVHVDHLNQPPDLQTILRFIVTTYLSDRRYIMRMLYLQCFDAVGWAAGRASGL